MASTLLGALAHPVPSLGLKLLAVPTGDHREPSDPHTLVPRPVQGSEELSRHVCLSSPPREPQEAAPGPQCRGTSRAKEIKHGHASCDKLQAC